MVDNPPVAYNLVYKLAKNSRWSINKTDFNLTDLDFDKLKFKVSTSPSSDVSTCNLTKQKSVWFYFPVTNFTGEIVLEYQAFDGVFWSNPANIPLIYI